jgi:Inhibitor of apoptosis-promoting Bax1
MTRRAPRSACQERGRCGIVSSAPGILAQRESTRASDREARALLDPPVPRCEPLIDLERATDDARQRRMLPLGGTVTSATLRSPRTVNRFHPEGRSPELKRRRATIRRDRRLVTALPNCPTADASAAGAIDTCPTSRPVTSEPAICASTRHRHHKRQHSQHNHKGRHREHPHREPGVRRRARRSPRCYQYRSYAGSVRSGHGPRRPHARLPHAWGMHRPRSQRRDRDRVLRRLRRLRIRPQYRVRSRTRPAVDHAAVRLGAAVRTGARFGHELLRRADPSGLWDAAGTTGAFVAGLGAYGYGTRRGLSAWGSTLFWVLVGLIVFGVVALLVSIPQANVIWSVAGLTIFGAFTIFDLNLLRPAGKETAVRPPRASSGHPQRVPVRAAGLRRRTRLAGRHGRRHPGPWCPRNA